MDRTMKLKDLLSNVKKDKITTGSAIAFLALVGLKIAGVDVEKKVGVPITDITLYMGMIIQSVILLFSRDPKK